MRFDLMINAFVYRAIHIGWMVVYQPDDRRSFLDVNDAAASYLLALDNHEDMAGRVFNVGDPRMNLTKREVAQQVASQFPMRVIYEDVAEDPDQRNYDVVFDDASAVWDSRRNGACRIRSIRSALRARLSDGEGPWRFHP